MLSVLLFPQIHNRQTQSFNENVWVIGSGRVNL